LGLTFNLKINIKQNYEVNTHRLGEARGPVPHFSKRTYNY